MMRPMVAPSPVSFAPPAVRPYERSARTDLRIWLMLAVGLGFAWAGSTIDPATNCDESGECAPWLVPVAQWMGYAFSLAGFGVLWANPRRGSRIDPVTGDLIWWQGRVGSGAGDEGRIHPSQIGRIRIVRESESEDQLHLYDRAGERQPYFDAEVVPWRSEQWAERLVREWPHILLEVEG